MAGRKQGRAHNAKRDREVQLYSRRDFCRIVGAASAAVGLAGFPAIVKAGTGIRRVMVMGVDGMDPRLLQHYITRGLMPNCKALIKRGCFSPLGTTTPPQSPVAWSSFISGSDPGSHGIFDFIARDAESLKPYLSTSRTTPPKHSLKLGKFSLPLSPAHSELLRDGATFWNNLREAGIDATCFKVPVNFPPTPSSAKTLAGITTPDIQGSYGIFSFYTESPTRKTGNVSGGQIERMRFRSGRAECRLNGPANSFRTDAPSTSVPFTVELDRPRKLARIRIGDRDLLLREGEWSSWVSVKFPMLGALVDVSGICRFFLKSVSPYAELYVSPVNIDPADPTMPISTPESYAKELVEEVGYFYTQGMPEDTSALSARVLNDDEYRQQATFVLEERMRFFRHELNRFREGFLFFYFSSLDLDSHAFWRSIDPHHPLYTEELNRKHGDFLPWLYHRIDEAVGMAMQQMDDKTLLMVISDHGFVSFRRQFNLNSWLMDNGYARPLNRMDRGQTSYFMNTDWSGTKAYGLGINSLYLNIRGREPDGIVEPGEEAEALRSELIARLTSIVDEKTGSRAIRNVYRPEEIYSGAHVGAAPDLVVCYNENYRASWDTILGKYPREVLLDNLDPWSGDHCMDPAFLSGVFMCNRPLQVKQPALQDLSPAILSAFGVPSPGSMRDRKVLG